MISPLWFYFMLSEGTAYTIFIPLSKLSFSQSETAILVISLLIVLGLDSLHIVLINFFPTTYGMFTITYGDHTNTIRDYF